MGIWVSGEISLESSRLQLSLAGTVTVESGVRSLLRGV